VEIKHTLIGYHKLVKCFVAFSFDKLKSGCTTMHPDEKIRETKSLIPIKLFPLLKRGVGVI
jgi:hypothetical protein